MDKQASYWTSFPRLPAAQAPRIYAIIRDATEPDPAAILAICNEAIHASTAVSIEQEATLAERRARVARRAGQNYPVRVAATSDPAGSDYTGTVSASYS